MSFSNPTHGMKWFGIALDSVIGLYDIGYCHHRWHEILPDLVSHFGKCQQKRMQKRQ